MVPPPQKGRPLQIYSGSVLTFYSFFRALGQESSQPHALGKAQRVQIYGGAAEFLPVKLKALLSLRNTAETETGRREKTPVEKRVSV